MGSSDAFPVVVVLPVQWGDMDAFQHVNNTVSFRWFESARIAYFEAVGWRSGILHSTSARYRLPLTYPDTVRVGVRVTEVGDDRFTMQHQAWSTAQGAVATEGTGIVVAYDYVAKAKARIDDTLRAAIARLEGGPLRSLRDTTA